MQKTIDSILTEALDITNYPSDKEEFIRQFHELNHLEAMTNVVVTLPKETQNQIKACNNDPEKIKAFIPADKYLSEFQKVTIDALKDFIHSVSFTVMPAEKEKLLQLISIE